MKKLLTLLVVSLMLTSLVACSNKEESTEPTSTPEASETTAPIVPDTNDYSGEVFDYSTVYPNTSEYYSLDLGTFEKTCSITVPADYTLSYANVQNEKGESSSVEKTGASFKEEIENKDFDSLALYSGLGFKSTDGSVELDVQAFQFGNGVGLESFDSLFEGNKVIEQLEGTAARCAVQSDVQGYDFYLFVEVNGENCVQIGYLGDDTVDAKEMALNVYNLITLQ